jgi:hypothetical protein
MAARASLSQYPQCSSHSPTDILFLLCVVRDSILVVRKSIVTDFDGFILFKPSWMRKSVLFFLLYAVSLRTYVMLVCLGVRLATPWTVGGILLTFVIQGFVCRTMAPHEYQHSSSKSVDHSSGPQNTKWIFSRKENLWRFWLKFGDLGTSSLQINYVRGIFGNVR